MNKQLGKPVDGQEDAFRYERKFALSKYDVPLFQHFLKMSPAGFRSAYPPRFVNNLYFDTSSYESLFDNVEGVANRTKLRVRWYGDLTGTVRSPFLEYKVKQGMVGTKRRFDLVSLEFDRICDVIKAVATTIQGSDLPPRVAIDLQQVRPTLLNRYRREYYQTRDGFRVTIDTDIENYSPTRHSRSKELLSMSVVELKYDADLELEASRIVDHWGLRVMKNSKYVAGLMATSY